MRAYMYVYMYIINPYLPLPTGGTIWTVPDLVNALIEIYCGNVGAEFLHIENEIQRNWLKNKIEGWND